MNGQDSHLSLIKHGCVVCNCRGTLRRLDQYGRDTGKNRPCLVCDGSGEVVASTTYRGAVEEHRAFVAGLTEALDAHGVPAMGKSWREAIDWLAAHGGQ
jgi:hypothetical protein